MRIYDKIKRILDFILSLISIIVFSPVFIIISFLIKLESKGPILFKQKRIGKDNKEFFLYKFRSMKIDTPNVATHLLEKPDTYITKIGKFLRKSSLDELPQLFNILKGEMSIVGPRPALYNQYDLKDERTKVDVHKLLPGLTGWAQINGRDELSIEEKVTYDKFYSENYSLLLDIKIILMTVSKVFNAEGIVEGSSRSRGISS